MVLYGPDRVKLQQAITAAFREIRRIDRLMSLHREDSELVAMNRRAGREPVIVSRELFEVLQKAEEIARATDGAFDITLRPLAELWGFINKEYCLPTSVEIEAALGKVGFDRVKLDPTHRAVRFTAPDTSVDLGGIAKGYAVDCAIAKLRALGVSNAMVRAGGDLRVLGAPPGKSHWTVQIEDPAKQGHRVSIPLRDAAISTSGNYENFFEVHGKRYCHILDPRTGRPVPGLAACSVMAPTCLESDAWATACFVYGMRESMAAWGDRLGMQFVLLPQTPGGIGSVHRSQLFPAPETINPQ